VTFSSLIWDPLRGKTSLNRVFWLYGVAGSAIYSVIGALFDVTNSLAMRIYVIGGLIFSIYVTVATYQCAGNCKSVLLARVSVFPAFCRFCCCRCSRISALTGRLSSPACAASSDGVSGGVL